MDAWEPMMTLRIGSQQGTDRRASAGFTLIELVLVMAILIVVLSMSAPSLTSFFKGRALDAEGHRFLALTRHAQNRAVSEGLPMTLWINSREGKYGLEIAPGFAELDAKAAEFQLGRDLEIDVSNTALGAAMRVNNEVLLRFSPDAFMDEGNPETIIIKEKNGEAVMIAASRNRLHYEISTNQIYTTR
jgi:type II secretion system protein H